MKHLLKNSIAILLSCFFLLAGTGVNIHCHCHGSAHHCTCAGDHCCEEMHEDDHCSEAHHHTDGHCKHCHTHYIHLADASQIVVGKWIPKEGQHDLLYSTQAITEMIHIGNDLTHIAEWVHRSHVPLPPDGSRHRSLLRIWLI